MAEKIEVGNVVTGKVTGIQPYGAFVSLDENRQGLIHISEITNGYVRDINDYVKVGDKVKVKVLSVDEEAGKIGLSLRATEEAPVQQEAPKGKRPHRKAFNPVTETPHGFNTLKHKLQEWIQQSQN